MISRIREAIDVYGLTASDLGLGGGAKASLLTKPPRANAKRRMTAAKNVAVKYRDAAGNTWTGRGSRPRWLTAALAEGKKIEDFAIDRRERRS